VSSPRVLGCLDDEDLASRRIDDRNTSRQDVSDPAIAPERPWRTRGGVAHVLSAVLSPKSRAAKDAAQRAATTAALRSVSVDGAIGKRGLATARHTLCGTTGTASRVPIPGGRDSPLVSSRVSSATVPVPCLPRAREALVLIVVSSPVAASAAARPFTGGVSGPTREVAVRAAMSDTKTSSFAFVPELFDGAAYGSTAETAVRQAIGDAEVTASAYGLYTCELAEEPEVFPQPAGSLRAFRAHVRLRLHAVGLGSR